jgi:CRP/FNR family transcriptional regulator, cyclic AMP receptor protein
VAELFDVSEGVAVLRADADLGRDLDPASREEAARLLKASYLALPRGEWDPKPTLAAGGGLGVLVLDGLIVRDVVLAGMRSTELIAAGDVIEPKDRWSDDRFVPLEIEWSVIEESRLAVLDDRFLYRAARWPRVIADLFDRAAERSFRLATHAAISQLGHVELRLQALMWHLAERWGKVSSGGVIVPLRVSHATLGRLVGARRPTVTLALKDLKARGEVIRRPDGAWVLPGEPPPELAAIEREARRRPGRGVRLIDAGKVKEAVETPSMSHAVLHERVAALRETCQVHLEETKNLKTRARALRQHSELLRENGVTRWHDDGDLLSQHPPSAESPR